MCGPGGCKALILIHACPLSESILRGLEPQAATPLESSRFAPRVAMVKTAHAREVCDRCARRRPAFAEARREDRVAVVEQARSRDVSQGRRPVRARTASCWRRASSTRACSLWLRKQARSEWSRAIAKESRTITAGARLRHRAVRHNAVEARGPCGTLAGRSRQHEGRRPSCENAQRSEKISERAEETRCDTRSDAG